ncbi:MAG: hypothetical protein M3300_04560, partial [Actinomycetota bacterium]|nr:hypothetical protein [Actinomycetota bacterium]
MRCPTRTFVVHAGEDLVIADEGEPRWCPFAGGVSDVPMIHMTLLGRFEVTVDTIPVAPSSWTRRHAATLVKVLAMAPGRRLHREQVIGLLWPENSINEA